MNETFVYYLLNVIFSANFKMLARETHYGDKHFLFFQNSIVHRLSHAKEALTVV